MLEKIFPQNESPADRGVRTVLGLVGLALVFWGPKTAWGWIGLLPLLTGITGTCPLYTLLGVATRTPAVPTAQP